jgi:hypothetical protein
MTATVARYHGPHTSEKLMLPYNGCRLSVLVAARGYETLGEAFVRPNGNTYTLDNRATMMKWLRRLAAQDRGESPTEAKGFSRDNALYAYAKAFPDGNAVRANDRPATIRARLEAGWFYSVSGNTKHTRPGSLLRRRVNPVAHEIGFVGWFDGDVDCYEPMTGYVFRVPFRDIKDFSSEYAFDQGRRLCIRFRIGWATAAAKARRQGREDLLVYGRALDQAAATIETQKKRIARLRERLQDPDEAAAAAREQFADAIIERAEELRAP